MRLLHEIIGSTSIDHAAFLVRSGKMIGAVSFFVDQLKWVEDEEAIVAADWGVARSVKPSVDSLVRVQLIEHTSRSEKILETFPGTHLALNVMDATSAAKEIKIWADGSGIFCIVEPVNEDGTKWFVDLSGLFTCKIELMSVDR